MTKLIKGALTVALLTTGLMAAPVTYTGEITYVQVRDDGNIAVKMLPAGETTEIYAQFKPGNDDQVKASYAMALTAMSTGIKTYLWKEGSYWTSIFLVK